MKAYATVQTRDATLIDDFMSKGNSIEELKAKVEYWLQKFDTVNEFTYAIYEPFKDSASYSRRGYISDIIAEEAVR